ncbi:FAD-binding protein [Streptomyces uncialis]|uniref:FAD-dependent oxidoreductase n=1 Tax=Streptomyces uncialis TaxID=1048205 RepID=UPI00386D85F4|nr:FAD-dependent oxidoreductase [Streptomyces uncialis]
MERRGFIGAGLGVTVVAGVTACGGGGGDGGAASSPSRSPSSSPSPSPGGTGGAGASGRGPGAEPGGGSSVAPSRAVARGWGDLARDLDGSLVRPGDQDWGTARLLYNTRFDSLRPAAVAYTAHADDVRTVLAYARARRVPVAIRNGGHSYAGWSSGDGRLIVDVSPMSAIRADGDSALVGAGAKLIDVYRALAGRGVTIPAGSCPTVGISGLTLGGGHGVVSRAYGLTCDHLTGATVITADGRRRVADARENSELFWALRGAGNGNFGVVTELRFRTRPAPRAVTGYMSWPWSRAAAVVRAWQEWGPGQPDEIWSVVHLSRSPGGSPTVTVSCFSLGTYGDLQNAVDRLADRIGASASRVTLRRRSYEEAMEVYAGCAGFGDDDRCRLPGSTPGRSPEGALGRETYAARSDFFDRPLSEEGVRALIGGIEGVRGGPGTVSLTALGGAVNRVAPTATAFVHRRSRTLAQYTVAWPSGTGGAAAREWLGRTHGAMRRHASGAAYQNYTDPSLTGWRGAYYGAAAARLRAVKRRYDPSGFFTFPQSL